MLRTILLKPMRFCNNFSKDLKTSRSLASNVNIETLKQLNNNDNNNNINNDTDAGVGVNKNGDSGCTITHRQLELDKIDEEVARLLALKAKWAMSRNKIKSSL
ncbi:hypothetical protein DOY81_014228 [Sarcophaga bullata]|nr:hypothetical protein DOY81_014228 [Sarcophaga bullata]